MVCIVLLLKKKAAQASAQSLKFQIGSRSLGGLGGVDAEVETQTPFDKLMRRKCMKSINSLFAMA